jgi:hypothetical protein
MKFIKRSGGIFAITLLLVNLAWGQVEQGDDEQTDFRKVPLTNARIEFDRTVFDFGSINKGASVAHAYWFANNGTDTLVITKIKPTCGCTITKTGGIVAAPGERNYIDVIFNSGKFNGRVTKVVKVETNDKLDPYMDIRFKATVNNPLLKFDYTPFEAVFKDVKPDKAVTFKIKITNKDSTESKLVIADKPAKDFIDSKLDKAMLTPGESTNLILTLSKDVEPGSYVSSITLEAEGKQNSRFTIPISLTIGDQAASN